jgi:hypothetical protein
MVAEIIVFKNAGELLLFLAMAPQLGPYSEPVAHSPSLLI